MVQQKPIFQIFKTIQYGRCYGDNFAAKILKVYAVQNLGYGPDPFHFQHETCLLWRHKNPYFKFSKQSNMAAFLAIFIDNL